MSSGFDHGPRRLGVDFRIGLIVADHPAAPLLSGCRRDQRGG
jgi:hypothetical protein